MVLPHALRHVTFLIVSSAVFLVTLSVSSSADDKLKVDLATIQRSWTEWRKSFATIRIVGREWDQASVFQYNPDVDQSKDEWREKFYSRDEFTWSDIGAFKHDRVHHKTGMANSRNAMGSDGANPWSASAPVASTRARAGYARPPRSAAIASVHRHPVTGASRPCLRRIDRP